jgi:uncharacterized protein YciI
MDESRKLIVAGPFEEGKNNQGVLIFDVETIDNVIQLENKDPRIKASELKMMTFYWWGAKGTVLK